jgi:cytochrome c oxidase subunit 2
LSAHVRRGSLIQLVLFGLIAVGICAAVALAIPWLPQAAGKEAHRIDDVFWFTTVIAIGVFSLVVAVLAYSVIHFRVGPDDDSDGPPTHGNTRLEMVWTAVPVLLVTSIAIVSAIVLAKNGNAGDHPLVVKVTGRQFAWLFTYPDGKSYGSLTIPEGRHTKLEITSDDVIHSFWVPQLSQKQDAVPGETNPLVITPTTTGTFPVICTELCGLGHALMRSHVTILTPAAFDTWQAGSSAAGASGGTATSGGLAVFQSSGCASCHTFKPASATGKIGPDLDNLKESAAKAGQADVAGFVKQSIVDPNAYIAPGFQANIMPGNFAQQIPSPKLDQLVQYLTSNTN